MSLSPAPPTALRKVTRESRKRHRHRCPSGKHPEPHRGCYTFHKCRCPGCREKNRLASRFYVDLHRDLEGRGHEGFTDAEATRARIRLLRESGLLQRDIAAMIGVTQSSVSQLLSGQPRVRKTTAMKVARALEEVLGRDHEYR